MRGSAKQSGLREIAALVPLARNDKRNTYAELKLEIKYVIFSFMKKILCLILKFFAKRIIRKYAPVVIGITGSVGKTSTKEAIFTVLRKKCPNLPTGQAGLRQNIKNYNNEIGLPLTIIGADTGGMNPIAWLKIFIKAIGLLLKFDANYPTILILEMGG